MGNKGVPIDQLNDEQLVSVYIQLRDRRAERKAAFTSDDTEDALKQKKIEAILMKRFNESGHDSVKTKSGTAYRKSRVTVSVSDWSTFFPWALEKINEGYEFFEQRANKTAVEAYREECNMLPPGIKREEEFVVNVRRA